MPKLHLPRRLDARVRKVYRLSNTNGCKKIPVFMEQDGLYERLERYSSSGYYPFHMPGHKRKDLLFKNPYQIDITEIDGFDSLHHADGILKDAQDRLKELYQSRKSYYLVNGSTCGLLSAIGASTRAGSRALIARNCHKSVYNAAKLFRLKLDYVYPEFMQCGIQGKINPDDIERSFKVHNDIRLVVVTSPTYDGIVSDIKKIAGIVHRHHAFLVVDEAHGAHFSLSSHFPESAVNLGADIVIQSLHKTLPSFTQTAALHIAGENVDTSKVEEMLGIFQSSSPSYLLMAGMDKCVKLLLQNREQLFDSYYYHLKNFYKACMDLKNLHILSAKDYAPYHILAPDESKIVISTLSAPMDGKMLYDRLLHQYRLQMEMYSSQYVLGMTSIMDTEEGFNRLIYALKEIDDGLCGCATKKETGNYFMSNAYGLREKALDISEVEDYNIEETPLSCCAGKICAEYIYLYPPGIPFLVPGEVVPDEMPGLLEACRSAGMNVQGTLDKKYFKLLTVKGMAKR